MCGAGAAGASAPALERRHAGLRAQPQRVRIFGARLRQALGREAGGRVDGRAAAAAGGVAAGGVSTSPSRSSRRVRARCGWRR